MAPFSMLHRVVTRLTPLTLLALSLACDRQPTAPDLQHPVPAPEASLLPSSPTISPLFDASQYFGIDVQRAAQQQYGSSAKAVTVSNHLYGWRALVGSQLFSIDMARAVHDQFGAGYILGAVGVGIYDWRAVRWSALSYKVLPVMVMARDYFFNVDAVQTGLANFQSALTATWNWYRLRSGVGTSFRMLQPLVVFNQSPYTAAQWNGFSDAGGETLWDFAWNAYASAYPSSTLGSSGAALRVQLAPFTGNSLSKMSGSYAANTMIGGSVVKAFAVAAPVATSIACPATGPDWDFHCSYATYDIGHYLGSTFGLADCVTAGCGGSIMGVAMPWYAALTSNEIAQLQGSPFFQN